MKLSIIIVNYKTPGLLLDCLASIYKFGVQDMEIIVVDNFSEDDTQHLLKSNFPAVRFMQMGYNAGFARANNAGIRQAAGQAVLLLNSDTIILDDAINISVDMFLLSDQVACGVQLLNPDGSPQISGNYAMRGGLNYLLPLPYLGKFLKAMAGLLKVQKPNVPMATGVVEVDWINGAYLMVKKSAIDKAGLLDEDFFLYAEEAEWCSRLKKAGRLCIYGGIHVLHLQGETANDAFGSSGKGYFNLFDRKGLQIMLSNFVRIRKQFGAGWFCIGLLFYLLAIPVFLIGLLISKLFRGSGSGYQFSQWAGYCKNVFALCGFAPAILANKPHFYKVL
jgi:GT2 family glycosyltransferase